MKFGIPAGVSIYCMECQKNVEATIENGETIYPHRPDLADHVFLRCPHCLNYVSADRPRKNDTLKSWQKRLTQRTIPNASCRNYRRMIHAIIDPLWQSGVFKRGYIYKRLKEATGTNYHNASVCDEEIMKKAYDEAIKLQREAQTLTGKKSRRSYFIRNV